MKGLNKVQLIGHLGRDTTYRVIPGETPKGVANLSIATSKKWTDRADGERRERTEWHRVVCFGKLADIARDFLFKGNRVYVEGELSTRSWEQDGHTRFTTEIIARDIIFLGNRNGNGFAGDDPQPADAEPTPDDQDYDPDPDLFQNFDDDDIPF